MANATKQTKFQWTKYMYMFKKEIEEEKDYVNS